MTKLIMSYFVVLCHPTVRISKKGPGARPMGPRGTKNFRVNYRRAKSMCAKFQQNWHAKSRGNRQSPDSRREKLDLMKNLCRDTGFLTGPCRPLRDDLATAASSVAALTAIDRVDRVFVRFCHHLSCFCYQIAK